MNTINLLLMILFTTTYAFNVHNKVLLKNVNALTLNQGQYTTSRRSLPVLQLNCVGGSAASESYKVKTVQCVNTGFDGKDYNWKCESVLPKSLRLGKLVVNCEGYDFPDDSYVLVGSCGLEYNLEYSGDYYRNQYTSYSSNMPYTRTTYTLFSNEYDIVAVGVISTIFVLFMMSVCCPMGCNSCCRYKRKVVGPMDRYVYPHGSSYYDGVVVGSMMSHKPVHTHTHTESFIGSSSGSSDSNSASTSTSFGGTKRR